jgi:hypothetical protein
VWPLLCYVVYFSALYTWRHSVVIDVSYIKSEVLWTKQAQFFVGAVNIHLRNAFGYCNASYVREQLDEALHAEENLDFLQNSLMYGSEAMKVRPGIHTSNEIYHLAMVDGCIPDSPKYYPFADCTTNFYGGIFGKGFMQGFREHGHITRELIAELEAQLHADPTLSSMCDPSGALNDGRMRDLDQMRWRYMAAGLASFAKIRLDEATRVFDNFQVSNIVITVATILALQLFYGSIYNRMIQNLDKEIKNVRLLLLLFPDEVSKQVPAIVNAGRELLSDASSVTSGSSS